MRQRPYVACEAQSISHLVLYRGVLPPALRSTWWNRGRWLSQPTKPHIWTPHGGWLFMRHRNRLDGPLRWPSTSSSPPDITFRKAAKSLVLTSSHWLQDLRLFWKWFLIKHQLKSIRGFNIWGGPKELEGRDTAGTEEVLEKETRKSFGIMVVKKSLTLKKKTD